jgi:hypothetical protein
MNLINKAEILLSNGFRYGVFPSNVARELMEEIIRLQKQLDELQAEKQSILLGQRAWLEELEERLGLELEDHTDPENGITYEEAFESALLLAFEHNVHVPDGVCYAVVSLQNELREAKEEYEKICTALGDYPSAESGHVADTVEKMRKELAELKARLDCRAGKLLKKGRRFIVVAVDEPYFCDVFNRIKENEMNKGRWTGEDEIWFLESMNEWSGLQAKRINDRQAAREAVGGVKNE